jgi:hypothetical protein
MTISRAFSTYPPGSPAREPSLQVPFTAAIDRDAPPPEPLLPISQSSQYISQLHWVNVRFYLINPSENTSKVSEVTLMMKCWDEKLFIGDQQRGFVYRFKQCHGVCNSPIFM